MKNKLNMILLSILVSINIMFNIEKAAATESVFNQTLTPNTDYTDKSIDLKNLKENFLEPNYLTEKNQFIKFTLIPVASYLFPGSGQLYEHQYGSGFFYSIGAITSLVWAEKFRQNLLLNNENLNSDYRLDLSSRNENIRGYMLSNRMYNLLGGMSAYQSFRSAVLSEEANGKYNFLPKNEKTKDLLLAPFDFSNFTKLRIAVPLLIAVLDSTIQSSSIASQNHPFSTRDFGYSSSLSLEAGIGEEMFYRGYVMPMFYQGWGNENSANLATSLIFTSIHISASNKVPWSQFLFSYYSGYLVMSNHWGLQESIFLHAWWDIIELSIAVRNKTQNTDSAVIIPLMNMTW